MIGKLLNQIAGDLAKDAKGMADELRFGARTRTITVAKPYCAPARSIITGALQPYGVKIYDIQEHTEKCSLHDFARRMKIEMRTFENLKYVNPIGAVMWLPMAIVANVTVSEDAAAWAEYLLLRTGRLYVPGEYVNARNARWAERHGGQMPPQWDKGEPMIAASCQAGRDAWQPVKNEMRNAKERKR